MRNDDHLLHWINEFITTARRSRCERCQWYQTLRRRGVQAALTVGPRLRHARCTGRAPGGQSERARLHTVERAASATP